MQGFARICKNQKQRHVVNMSALHRHLIHEFLEMHHAFKLNSSAEEIFYQTLALHEFHETCHSFTFYFMKKTHFVILAGSPFSQI